MARFNKIYAGPTRAVSPQVKEATSAVALLPGRLVVLAAGAFALAGAATEGKAFVVQENYLTQKGVDTAWTIGDTVVALELDPACLYRMRLATGQNIAEGAALTFAANGELTAAGAADHVVAVAHEAYNNTTGSGELITVRPAIGYTTAA